MPHRTLTLQQAARQIRISERDLHHLVLRDEVPFQRRGDEVVFVKRLLHEWCQRRILGLTKKSLAEHHRDAVSDRTREAAEDALIPRLFRPGWMLPGLASRTKPAVLRDMVTLARSTGLLYDDAAFLRELEDRESVASTAIGGGAAFLHTRFHDPYHASDSFVVLGRTLNHIFFGAQDGEETDLFFLIYCTDDALHLHTLTRLCMLAHGTDLFPALRAAADGEELYRLLAQAERELLNAL
jgi:mannitol/fructose-specific phosphotransferase system IIA component (Ntr-type)